ncbi:hypothetical protein CFD26_104920 [Aspergillus turcosus]|uniref:Cyanovirin-N domain-containing protein n=1 Tax=Aspergillus turcosus TaxID=1245748 RepID=A0A3R7LXE8_9EURO|nr:hypothetical protein CFD26_104920 [Aspergillus turcosus]
MSLGQTCEAITVSNHGVLECRAQREDGTWETTLFNLNKYIGNDNGRLAWDGRLFATEAQNVRLQVEDGHPGRHAILRASLETEDGMMTESELDLNQRIQNHGGQLEYKGRNPKGIEVHPVLGSTKTPELPLQSMPDQVVTVQPLSAVRTSKERPGLGPEHMVPEPDLINMADDPPQAGSDHVWTEIAPRFWSCAGAGAGAGEAEATRAPTKERVTS